MDDTLYDLLDVDGNVISSTYLGLNQPSDFIGQTVDDIIVDAVVPNVLAQRRKERDEVFAKTIDKLNWFWAEGLTTEQQSEIQTWRQAWLDYPETGIKPEPTSVWPYIT